MSDWHAEVARIATIERHDNADALEIAMVYGTTPVVTKKGQFQAGDLAAYIPVDSVLPDRPEFSFLQASDRRRLKAKRLRGVFSMGLLVEAPPGLEEGASVVDHFELVKYEPPEPGESGINGTNRGPRPKTHETAFPPCEFPLFTDIEGYRRHKHLFREGEQVVVREKIHGCNARYMQADGVFYIGSRTVMKSPDTDSVWAEAARRYRLAEKLDGWRGVAIYGEVYGLTPGGGRIQDLTYNAMASEFVMFDAFKDGQWLSDYELRLLAKDLDLPLAPVIYEGPWQPSCLDLAEGVTILGNGKHVREGFVVRPVVERQALNMPGGRCILKHVGEGYLTRKEPAQKAAA